MGLVFVMVLSGCTWITEADIAARTDRKATPDPDPDADGYTAADGDCAPDDPAVNPAAVEACNGLDDDCDGSVDPDDAEGCIAYFRDGDGDGYGDATLGCTCDAPDAASTLDGDCDDADTTVSPAGAEACGGVDEDCDGSSDEAGATGCLDVWPDADGDGHGAMSGDAVCLCPGASGWVVSADDCDDADGEANPDVVEVCADGKDDDCDTTTTCTYSGEIRVDAADTHVEGVAEGVGGSLAVGDADGDGTADLLVGAEYLDDIAEDAGGAYVVSGPIARYRDLSEGTPLRLGVAEGDRAGAAVAAGDLDGDGVGDLVVGAPGVASYSGAVFVVRGPVTGEGSLAEADAELDHPIYGWAGWHLRVDDLDGDGLDDLVVGAHAVQQAGTTYIVHGPVVSGSLADADVALYGVSPMDHAGSAVTTGDLDGDGLRDLVLGAYSDDDGGTDAGAAYVVLGPVDTSGSLGDADMKLVGENPGDYASGVEACDIDADGRDDLLVAAKFDDAGGTNAGAVYRVGTPALGSTDLSLADAKLYGAEGDTAGYAIGCGDLNGDGRGDAVVGAPLHDGADADAGAAFLIDGAFSGTIDLSLATAMFTGTAGDQQVGTSLLVADFDGDGGADLLIGAPGGMGSVYVFRAGGE